MSKIKELNSKYEELADGKIYPFLSKNRITILEKGFYKKKKANFRGISMIYDVKYKKFKVLLIGYFYVPKNMIIIHEGLIITDNKRKLITDKLAKGYDIIVGFPSLVPYEFDQDSEEYQEAKNINDNFNSKK